MKPILDLSVLAASLAAPGTVIVPSLEAQYDWTAYATFVASLTGLTGGSLDVSIHDSPDQLTWYEYCRYPLVTAAAALANYSYTPAFNDKVQAIGVYPAALATPVPVLASGTGRGGHPFAYLRAVFIAGAGTSVGRDQNVRTIAR